MAPPAAHLNGGAPGAAALDETRLREALQLAEGSIGLSDPNPRVGCVLGFADSRVIGRGCTQEAGGPHAEVMALRDAAAQGHDTRGATAWVTLEPCAHHGRTPPCCDALIAAGIARVVVAVGDPFPAVAGRGVARLRAAGLEVVFGGPAIAAAARDINRGFFSRIERGRPWVRMKLAASLDGRTALPDGRSQWITGPAARTDTHAWRRRASVVLTGVGTVLADDPRLDVRHVPTARQPLRVVLDRHWRMPPAARILAGPGRAMVIGTNSDPARRTALETAGAITHTVSPPAAPPEVLGWLAENQANEVHLEAGPTLSGAWLASGCVDELLLYLAPCLLGEGLPLAHLPPLFTLEQALRWRLVEALPVGDDLRLRLQQPTTDSVEKFDTPVPPGAREAAPSA